MATEILYFVQSLWPSATSKNDDLRMSDRLVRGLKIPDETKQFVFAIQDPESQAVIYILCAQKLSERSARDAERLIRCVNPEAVVAQVNEVDFGGGGGGDGDITIPTSSLEVLKRCFLANISTYMYEDMALCTGFLVFDDGIECAVESVPAAPSIACLGRGIERLHQASQAVEHMESSRIQKSIDSLVNRFKKLKQVP